MAQLKTDLLEGTRFRLDYGAYLSQHDISFKRPPLRAADCLAMGNGDVGLQIDGTGSQRFFGFVMKSDVWDRGPADDDPIGRLTSWDEVLKAKNNPVLMRELETKEVAYRYGRTMTRKVMPKALGAIRLDAMADGRALLRTEELEAFDQRLVLWDAVVTTSFLWRGALRSSVTSYVHSGRNVIVTNVRDQPIHSVRRRAILTRNPDPRIGAVPEVGTSREGHFWLQYTFPGGFRYAMVGLVGGVRATLLSEGYQAFAEFRVDGQAEYTLFVSAVTSAEHHDPLVRAQELVEEASRCDQDALKSEHSEWWHDFWQRSFISIDDKEIENAWYVGQYELARSQRGAIPAWLLWAEQENDLPWNGAYWDIMVNNYLGCFTANHPELAEPYFRTHAEMLPAAQRNARELYRCSGARYAHEYAPDGLERGPLWTRLMNFASAYVGMLFWWNYLYTMDRRFLKDTAYPVLRECAAFYLDWLEGDEASGKYSMPSPSCPFNEVLWSKAFEARNSPLELSLVKRLLWSVISASELLGVDKKARRVWKDVAGHLSDLPTDGRIYLEYEGATPAENALWAVDSLSGIYPALTESLANPIARATVRDSLQRLQYPSHNSVRFSAAEAAFLGTGLLSERPLQTTQIFACPALAASAAWLGEAELFIAALALHMEHHLLPNGFFGEDRIESPYNPGQLIPSFALPEHSGDFVGAVNEALVKSLYDGTVEVFKGLPAEWEARFAGLRTVGAFLVSSERLGGNVRYVVIRSTRGGTFRLARPPDWNSRRVRVANLSSGKESEAHGEVITFETVEGGIYVIDLADLPAAKFPLTNIHSAPKVRQYIGLAPRPPIAN